MSVSRVIRRGALLALLGVSVSSVAEASPCPVDVNFIGPTRFKAGRRYNLVVQVLNAGTCNLELTVLKRLPSDFRYRRASPMPDHELPSSRLLIWDSMRLKRHAAEAVEIGIEIEGRGNQLRRTEVCLFSEKLEEGVFCKSFEIWVE